MRPPRRPQEAQKTAKERPEGAQKPKKRAPNENLKKERFWDHFWMDFGVNFGVQKSRKNAPKRGPENDHEKTKKTTWVGRREVEVLRTGIKNFGGFLS